MKNENYYKKQNKELKTEIKKLKAEIGEISKQRSEINLKIKNNFTNSSSSEILKYDNFFKYQYSRLKNTSLWNISNKIFKYSKRYLLISKILRYSVLVIAWIETSALFIIFMSVFIVMIPAIIAICAFLFIYNIIQYKKFNNKLENEFENKKIYIFFASTSYYYDRKKYFNYMVEEGIKGNDILTFVVTPSIIYDRFSVAHKEKDNLWIIKTNYFFVLKKRYLNAISKKAIYIY